MLFYLIFVGTFDTAPISNAVVKFSLLCGQGPVCVKSLHLCQVGLSLKTEETPNFPSYFSQPPLCGVADLCSVSVYVT